MMFCLSYQFYMFQGGAGDDSLSFGQKSFTEMDGEASISSKNSEISDNRYTSIQAIFWDFL